VEREAEYDHPGPAFERQGFSLAITEEEGQMKSRFTKQVLVAGSIALAGLGFAAQPAVAQDKTIRVGITLRMMVESGMAYGEIAKSEIEHAAKFELR